MIGPVESTGKATAAQPSAELTQAARGFEELLVQQLAATLVASAEGEDESEGAGGTYRELLPDALSKGIGDAGGIGLSDALARTLAGGVTRQ